KEIFLLSQKEKLKQELKKLQDEVLKLEQEIQKEIPDLKKLEEEIEKAEKEFINLEHQTKELTRLNNEIKQVRTQYVQIKEALSKLENETGPIEKENLSFKKITEMIHSELEVHVAELKSDLRSLVQLTHEKKQGEALEQKLIHIKESIKNSQTSIEEFSLKVENNNKKIQEIQTELQAKLEGKSAQEELNSLQTRIKTASGEFQNAQQVHKTHEQSLSLKRGNLSSLEQLLKDYELKFIETLMEIRNLGQEEEAPIQENIQNFEEKLKGISLTLNDSIEVILASKEFIHDILNDLDSKLTELSNELGVIKEKISHWEKTQDKIKLLRIEYEEAKSKVERFKRLSTILGTDELRTFALSLVEENLILQTNEELSHLCDSRYEIIHQSRRGITPEFYILDKFRGGETRKVSTLSGGETFMVSLAMALALAEMTRGQAEIDTLFIDEGFGTLDQESLEDVLEMLNQIQNRGLMIGIISHIKTLTQALAVNLVLTKAQDGTSKLSIQYN
ncbi:MAG: SbcC/MukB-like Walker B domain-containing protein, partial [Candidatus Caldatribacteriota bacterium]